MTLEAEKIELPPSSAKSDKVNSSYLEELYYLGYVSSDKITIFRDEEKKVDIFVVFRTLTPIELRDIYEASGKYSTNGGQAITEKLETLARCIKTVNEMPLILDAKDRQDFFAKLNRDPTPLEQARIILIDKIKSTFIINEMFNAYQEFLEKVETNLSDIKKKLKNPPSLEST